MSGFTDTSAFQDFDRRLQDALQRVRGAVHAAKAPLVTSAAPSAAPVVGPPEDAFRARLLRLREGPRPSNSPTGGEPMAQTGPVGAGDHVVRLGECVHSIAYEAGFFWQTVWDDPANQELKRVRKDPAVLLAGDRVTIPPMRRKDESCPAEQRHRFRQKGYPKILRIQITFLERPVANEAYTLEIDGRATTGSTDAGGWLIRGIPPNARRGLLTIQRRRYTLNLGHLGPVEELIGVQARLRTLGLYMGAVDGAHNDATVAAIREFQKSRGLEPTGQPDEPTRRQLVERTGD